MIFLINSDSLEHHSNLTGSQGKIGYQTRDKTFGKSWDQTRVLLPQISFRDHSNLFTTAPFGGFFKSQLVSTKMHSAGRLSKVREFEAQQIISKTVSQ